MYIYLIRHGETDWNLAGKAQGREDIPLNAMGLSQAEAVAAAFADVPLDLVVTSPLKRAVSTADVIAKAKGLPSPIEDATLIEPRLIERDYGCLSGTVVSKENRHLFFEDNAIDGLESNDSVRNRTLPLLRSYALKPYQHVLMVTHGAAIMATLEGLKDETFAGPDKWLVNTCINVIEATATPDGSVRLKVLYCNLNSETFATIKAPTQNA